MTINVENLIDRQQPLSNGSIEWRLRVEPGKNVIKELGIEDVTKRTSLKYAFNFKNYSVTPLNERQRIIQACIEKGIKY